MSDDNTTETKVVTEEVIPEWARKKITEANNEAAKYRTEKNNIEAETTARLKAEFDAQFKALSDEKSAILAERDTSALNYKKLNAALAAGVPGETAVKFAGLLQGSSDEELATHAEELKSMFGTPTKIAAVDPSHGAGNGGGVTGMTTDAAWADLMKSSGIY